MGCEIYKQLFICVVGIIGMFYMSAMIYISLKKNE